MNRRDFSVGAACVIGAAALGLPAPLRPGASKPEDGTEYMTLDKRVPVDAPAGKVEVIEFFWYSCPHCNAFEPRLEAWIKKLPADVVLQARAGRLPRRLRAPAAPVLHAGGHGQARRIPWQGVPRHPRRTASRSTGKTPILAWAGKQGLDKAKFKELYNSFSVAGKARRATQLQDAFQVQGVPAIGIAGRYYTDGDLAGNMDRALAGHRLPDRGSAKGTLEPVNRG